MTFPVPPQVSEVIVRRPDDAAIRLTPEAGRVVFDDTARLGPYQVILRGEEGAVEQTGFAVNLFSPMESAIAPRQTLPVRGIAPGSAGETVPSRAWRELWRGLALVALVLLVIEWLVYQGALRIATSVLATKVRSTQYAVRNTRHRP